MRQVAWHLVTEAVTESLATVTLDMGEISKNWHTVLYNTVKLNPYSCSSSEGPVNISIRITIPFIHFKGNVQLTRSQAGS